MQTFHVEVLIYVHQYQALSGMLITPEHTLHLHFCKDPHVQLVPSPHSPPALTHSNIMWHWNTPYIIEYWFDVRLQCNYQCLVSSSYSMAPKCVITPQFSTTIGSLPWHLKLSGTTSCIHSKSCKWTCFQGIKYSVLIWGCLCGKQTVVLDDFQLRVYVALLCNHFIVIQNLKCLSITSEREDRKWALLLH